MDFRRVPSCTEVSSWSPDALINYFRMCNLKECQKLVKKQGINGKRFLEMSENDMQKFPKVTVPILIRIQQEMNKKEEKKGLFPMRPETQKCHSAGKLQGSYTQGSYNPNTSENWSGSESDSFEDDDDDHDYEHPEDDSDYESPTPADENSVNSDSDYEPPPSSDQTCPINPTKTNIGDTDYVDRPVPGNYPTFPPNPPTRPELRACPARGKTFPGAQSSLNHENHRIAKPPQQMTPPVVHRDTKPIIQINSGKPSGKFQAEQTVNSATQPLRLRQQVPVKPEPLRKPPLPNNTPLGKPNYMRQTADSEDISVGNDDSQRLYPYRPYNSNTFPSTSPKPSVKHMSSGSNTLPITDISYSGSGVPQYSPYKSDNRFAEGAGNVRPPVPIPGSITSQYTTSGNEGLSSEQWYLGSISRRDAENALRSINQDGTFLVRNCSQSTTSQPYVLMVLYRTKVYNVRIRYDQNNKSYLLGSGGQETFGSVTEIINFFRQTPLLLIDGKDRGSRQHCKLTCIATRSFH